jgi:phosphoglycerol transferase MdoB-like AlkP superfamily enzyme
VYLYVHVLQLRLDFGLIKPLKDIYFPIPSFFLPLWFLTVIPGSSFFPHSDTKFTDLEQVLAMVTTFLTLGIPFLSHIFGSLYTLYKNDHKCVADGTGALGIILRNFV